MCVVLAIARTAAERSAIDAWARTACPRDVEVVGTAGDELTRRLARDDDPLILPVGVTWVSDDCRVVVADPARESALRERWVVEAWGGPGTGVFAAYLEHEAALALDRAL